MVKQEKLPQINLEALDKAIYLALYRTYFKAIIEGTPVREGFTRNAWDLIKVAPFTYKASNPRGEIVLFIEKGTRPHIIRAKNKKSLRWKDKGQFRFAKQVNHPGFEGTFFIEKILRSKTLEKQFTDEIEKYLAKAQ